MWFYVCQILKKVLKLNILVFDNYFVSYPKLLYVCSKLYIFKDKNTLGKLGKHPEVKHGGGLIIIWGCYSNTNNFSLIIFVFL